MKDKDIQARAISSFKQCRYLAYPHTNGFADGGGSIILGQRDAEILSLWRCDLATSAETKLCEWSIDFCGEDTLWFDVALRENVLITVADNAVWKIDLNEQSPQPQLIYRESNPEGALHALPSISADGTRIVLCRLLAGLYQIIEIGSSANGSCGVLFESTWFANHGHFSPHDERWIGFAHEGPTEQVGDRVWGWHESRAPQGEALFDNGSLALCVGHERWSFHATSLVAVAYGVSPSGPRGIYEVFPESGKSRLVSEGDRDWHVNISQDGRWVVVDTTGPHDAAGRGWENAEKTSDILLIDAESGRRQFIARSRFSNQFHLHPHPTFSPNGEMVFFNEASPDGLQHRVMAVANPWANKA